ncbi:hypothetical protein N9N28_15340 [Rubripirellula amarantea]|nr:hypothetical protein [Rubripirellula amarantea]
MNTRRYSFRSNTPVRFAVTLMECIFAIGVILTGLVGLAALIPVAGRNAQAAIEIDRSISESTSASAMGEIADLRNLDRLVIFDKTAAGQPTVPDPDRTNDGDLLVYEPSQTMQIITSRLALAGDGRFNHLTSPGYMHGVGQGLTAGICIDPLGMPQPNFVASGSSNFVSDSYVEGGIGIEGLAGTPNDQFQATLTTDCAFDYSRFPYLSERYRPIDLPNNAVAVGGYNAATIIGEPPVPGEPMSPRMWRATLRASTQPFTMGQVKQNELITFRDALSIFQGSGSLAGLDANDKEDPRAVLMGRTSFGGTRADAGRERASRYTWFATLAPTESGATFRQSIIAVRDRVFTTPRRSDDPSALQKLNYTITDAEDNPEAEVLTWIDPESAVGFQGGAGGEITIYGSQAVSNEVADNSWVMLARQPHVITTAGTDVVDSVSGPPMFRWYRVSRVGEVELESDIALFDDGNGPTIFGTTAPVWRRRIALAGPDWTFDDDTNTNSGTERNDFTVDDTFCTIVKGAVSVIESEVFLE